MYFSREGDGIYSLTFHNNFIQVKLQDQREVEMENDWISLAFLGLVAEVCIHHFQAHECQMPVEQG